MIESVERLFGISYGRFFLEHHYQGKDPYGFGIRYFPRQVPHLGMGAPLSGEGSWAYLTVQFPADQEPTRLRPEQTLQLLAQRPHHEVCTLLNDSFDRTIDFPVEIIAKAPNLLKQMEYAYRLKKYKNGDLKLVPQRGY